MRVAAREKLKQLLVHIFYGLKNQDPQSKVGIAETTFGTIIVSCMIYFST